MADPFGGPTSPIPTSTLLAKKMGLIHWTKKCPPLVITSNDQALRERPWVG